jgi:thioredoxin 1
VKDHPKGASSATFIFNDSIDKLKKMTPIIDLDHSNFDKEVIKRENPIIVEFYSPGCPHCKKFKPIFEKLAESFDTEIDFARFDVMKSESDRQFVYNHGIHGVPTTEVYYEGRHIGNIVGYHPLDRTEKIITDFLEKKYIHVGPHTHINQLNTIKHET